MGVVRLTFLMIFYTLVIGLLIMTLPGIPPDLKLEAIQLRPPRKLEGKLTRNDILDKVEIFVDGKVDTPESIAIRGDDIFTGTGDGAITKIDKNGKVEKVVDLGPKDCVRTVKVRCSRPLGVRFNTQGKLLVADAYNGIYEVDVDARTQKLLLAVGTPLSDGIPLNFPDDLDVDKEGIIYFSDVSTYASFHNLGLEALGEPSGRLVQFDPKTQQTVVLIDGLQFANGVQLSKNEDFVLVAETIGERVMRYYIRGPKRGHKERMLEGLPGLPDNIRSNGKGGFYVALNAPDTDEHPLMVRKLLALPSVRRLILRVQHLLLKAVEIVDSLSPNPATTWAYYYVCEMGPLRDMKPIPRKVIVVDVDESGNIIGSLQNTDERLGLITEMQLGQKYSYFGGVYEKKLWRIKTEYLV